MADNKASGIFLVDSIGIPYGKCMDCKHCKFRYKDDNYHCELIEEKNDICRFELDSVGGRE